MLFSIIVPTYNRPILLRETLKSLLQIRDVDFEIIVTDNSDGNDSENEVVKIRDSRIRYFKNPCNLGMAENHNRALKKCKGDYIHIFSDDDLLIDPYLLKRRMKIFLEHPKVALIHGDIIQINQEGKLISYNHWARVYGFYHESNSKGVLSSYIAFNLLLTMRNFLAMPSVTINRSLVEPELYFSNEYRFLIDWDLWLRIANISDFYFDPVKSVAYRLHQNTLKQMNELDFLEELRLLKKDFFEGSKAELDDLCREQLEIGYSKQNDLSYLPSYFQRLLIRIKYFSLRRSITS